MSGEVIFRIYYADYYVTVFERLQINQKKKKNTSVTFLSLNSRLFSLRNKSRVQPYRRIRAYRIRERIRGAPRCRTAKTQRAADIIDFANRSKSRAHFETAD